MKPKSWEVVQRFTWMEGSELFELVVRVDTKDKGKVVEAVLKKEGKPVTKPEVQVQLARVVNNLVDFRARVKSARYRSEDEIELFFEAEGRA